MELIHIEQVRDYGQRYVREAVERIVERSGGATLFFPRGATVLLKPNLLAGKAPERAVTTHPALVEAVAGLGRECGCRVMVGDSPGMGTFQRVAEASGIAQAVKRAGAELMPFDETVEVSAEGTFRRITVARAYLEADRIINLPKLKTHEMMTLTCAVKNLFGAVVGPAKAGWHLAAGSSRELFAQLLLEIYLLKKPALNIVDGIVAMEGDGPSGGDPLGLGALFGGVNPVAVDLVAGRLAGLPENLLYVEREAKRRGLTGATWDDIRLSGVPLDAFDTQPFRLPKGMDVQFGLPGFLKRPLRRQLTARPVADGERCVLCGACRDTCPPGAITFEKNRLVVDHRRCILCWCCRELCPHEAMGIERGALLRIVEVVGGRRKRT